MINEEKWQTDDKIKQEGKTAVYRQLPKHVVQQAHFDITKW